MSSALFEITVLDVRPVGYARFRCMSINAPSDRAVTRSFVVRMLGADPDLVDEPDAPHAMIAAVRVAALGAWPESDEEARDRYAPVIDKLVTRTRVAASEVTGAYELEVDFPDPKLLAGLRNGQVFATYAHDVWWEDPMNPLASETQRQEWQAKLRASREAEVARDRSELDQRAIPIERWLEAAADAKLIGLAPEARAEVARKIVGLIDRADDPVELAQDISDYLMNCDAVEEVFVEDDVLLRSLAPLLS